MSSRLAAVAPIAVAVCAVVATTWLRRARRFRASARAGSASAGSAQEPPSLLLRLLDDDDLATAFLCFVPAPAAARCGLTCRAALQRLTQRETARLCKDYGRVGHSSPMAEEFRREQGLEYCREGEPGFPDEGATDSQAQSWYVHVDRGQQSPWTFHRLHLWHQTPVFDVIAFDAVSDAISHVAERRIGRAAQWLSLHPGLVIQIDGYHAAAGLLVGGVELGPALAQARAARVRQHLLRHLRDIARERATRNRSYWASEDTDEGVYPGGSTIVDLLTRGVAMSDVRDFYTPDDTPRAVGSKVRAEGSALGERPCREWSSYSRKEALADDELHGRENPNLFVEISVVGFEPHSDLAM